ncbi:MAG: hypothetical protein LBQ74_20180 [Prevotella sp.]|jgi:hypothetical protein|nr:hypothetical protein [Prevotella sp.]
MAYTFISVPRAMCFYRKVFFISARTGRNYGLILTLPIQWKNSQILTFFALGYKVHVLSPFQFATLVCSPAGCGYLTPSLSVPKRTGEFLIVQSSKGLLSHKKAFLFLFKKGFYFSVFLLVLNF